jgi:Hemerythrin HHE cation binding domain
MLANHFHSVPGDGAVEDIRPGEVSRGADGYFMSTASVPQIEEDHFRMSELLRNVQALLDDGSFFNGHSLQAVELLKGLSRQLTVHFALEETYDSFAGPDAVALELAGLADALRSEHRALAREFDGVVEQAELLAACAAGSEPDQRRVATRIRVFCHRLREHERRENELLLQAYEEDVGVGD